jgi:metal-dependent amidase/aminoacylase/carboxypeptidase family protein
MNIIRFIARILVGVVFIYSGFVKGIDPLGSTYKFTDYFFAFGLDSLESLAFPLAVFLSTVEFIIGVSLLFGVRMVLASWAALLFMAFFTPLTFYLALHNIPGFQSGHVIVRDGTFSSASVGMTIQLTGKTSHAGYPEHGINPGMAVAEIIRSFNQLSNSPEYSDEGTFITLVQVALGEHAFGTSAGNATMRATLRSSDNDLFQKLIDEAKKMVYVHSKNQGLQAEISMHEEFLATDNDPFCNKILRQVSSKLGLMIVELKSAFRWSEDFSWFTKKFKGCLFGIGSGIDHPQLHNPDYDFPDEIIEPAIDLFYKISKEIQHTFSSEKENDYSPIK